MPAELVPDLSADRAADGGDERDDDGDQDEQHPEQEGGLDRAVARGTWSIERRRDRAQISVGPFEDLPARTRKAVADEARDVARFQGLPSEGADLLWSDRSAG